MDTREPLKDFLGEFMLVPLRKGSKIKDFTNLLYCFFKAVFVDAFSSAQPFHLEIL